MKGNRELAVDVGGQGPAPPDLGLFGKLDQRGQPVSIVARRTLAPQATFLGQEGLRELSDGVAGNPPGLQLLLPCFTGRPEGAIFDLDEQSAQRCGCLFVIGAEGQSKRSAQVPSPCQVLAIAEPDMDALPVDGPMGVLAQQFRSTHLPTVGRQPRKVALWMIAAGITCVVSALDTGLLRRLVHGYGVRREIPMPLAHTPWLGQVREAGKAWLETCS